MVCWTSCLPASSGSFFQGRFSRTRLLDLQLSLFPPPPLWSCNIQDTDQQVPRMYLASPWPVWRSGAVCAAIQRAIPAFSKRPDNGEPRPYGALTGQNHAIGASRETHLAMGEERRGRGARTGQRCLPQPLPFRRALVPVVPRQMCEVPSGGATAGI